MFLVKNRYGLLDRVLFVYYSPGMQDFAVMVSEPTSGATQMQAKDVYCRCGHNQKGDRHCGFSRTMTDVGL